jgi:hypothetical protein
MDEGASMTVGGERVNRRYRSGPARRIAPRNADAKAAAISRRSRVRDQPGNLRSNGDGSHYSPDSSPHVFPSERHGGHDQDQTNHRKHRTRDVQVFPPVP